ncbi:hypothetical protein SUGI_0827480 [Cryptomeria japonica]|nr:hypothetical protein SUGI_0827480 [Cryptomeria japonica]
MAHLAPKTTVLRDGRWQEEDASILVLGDIISINLGHIIAVDARMCEGDSLKIDHYGGNASRSYKGSSRHQGSQFLSFNPVDKHITFTNIGSEGNWHRASKGAPEQILDLRNNQEALRIKVHGIMDKFTDRGLRSLVVARQQVPKMSNESAVDPREFVEVTSGL